ncbi:MAG: LAGLIDADG family homing endonuclease [Microbacterium sp.]
MSEALSRLLKENGMTKEDFDRAYASGGGPKAFARGSVANSADLKRILALPRRSWQEQADTYVNALTEHFRAPGGTHTLRPVQAAALVEMHDFGGLLGLVRVGGGKCAEFDTEVFCTTTGRRRQVGETGPLGVTAMQERTGRFSNAAAVAFASGSKECFRLVLANGMALNASFDHPVFTARGWVWMRDLQVGDLVATARRIPDPETHLQVSDEVVKFAAYLIADGGVSQVTTRFCDDAPKVLSEVRALAEALCEGTGYERPRDNSVEEFNILGAQAFRDRWGIHGLSKHKRVPAEFWGLPKRQIALFLNRFWACDGYHNKGRGFETTLASEKLIDDLQFLLLRLGIKGRKRFKVAKIKGKQYDAWRLSITGADAIAFYEQVGAIYGAEERSRELYDTLRAQRRNTNTDVVPVGPEQMEIIGSEMGWSGRGKAGRESRRSEFRAYTGMTSGQLLSRERFAAACDRFGYKGSLAWLATSDIAWERVSSLTPRGVQPVYDVSVPTHGNFVANGIVIHNTLISMLGFIVLEAKRPLLLVPAKLVEKTRREMHAMRKNWLIPPYVRILSYELLGREQAARTLEEINPDVIIADEVHKLKSTQAAVTRRVKRWMEAHPETKFVGMSGTVTKRSLHDYYHLAAWALKKTNPTPVDFNARMEWAQVLDEKKRKGLEDLEAKITPGALIELCNSEERELYKTEPVRAVRLGYRRRLVDTPGVVATQEGALGMSLIIDSQIVEMPDLKPDIIGLKKNWQRPDGEPILDAIELWRHLREMSCGFFYRWNPMPPKEWLEMRRAWAREVRDILRHNRSGLDSESQIRRAVLLERLEVERGDLRPSSRKYQSADEALVAWQAMEPTFKPHTEAVWRSNAVIEAARQWMETEKGIVWVEHTEFGRRLSETTGIPYYQKGGLNAAGKPIEDHPPKTPLIASIASNAEGRNLQAWNTNLITSAPTSGALWEQLLGRTHRDGQMEDEVFARLLVSLDVQAAAFERARGDARFISDTTGQEQKLCYADVSVVSAADAPSGM